MRAHVQLGPCIFGQFDFQFFKNFENQKRERVLLAFRRFERIEYWKKTTVLCEFKRY